MGGVRGRVKEKEGVPIKGEEKRRKHQIFCQLSLSVKRDGGIIHID